MKHFNNLKRSLAPLLLFLVAASPVFALNFSGTYQIPSATFPTVASACTQLSSGTVTGPTVFNIVAGTYTGATAQGTIGGANGVSGVSATNTVTFQAESGPGTVTLSPAGSSYATDFVFRLQNANYIIIKDLTLNNTGATYGASVTYEGSSSYNTVTNCVLTGSTTTTTSNYKFRILAYAPAVATSGVVGVTGVNNTVTGCTIQAAAGAFYLYGSDGTIAGQPRPSNWIMSNNTITPVYYATVYGYYFNNLKVRNNTITSTSSSTFYGLGYMNYCDSAMEFSNNNMTVTGNTSTYYGLLLQYCYGKAGWVANLTNNTLNATTTASSIYPFYQYLCDYDSFANNTVIVNTSSSGTIYNNYCQYTNYLTLQNNIMTMTSTGGSTIYPLYVYGYYSGNQTGNFNKLIGNTINTNTSSSIYNYWQYQSNYEIRNNVINSTSSSSGTVYGLYDYSTNIFANGAVTGNKIFAKSTNGTVYGVYCAYHVGDVVYANNAIDANAGSGSTYAFYCYYNYGGGYTFTNNTIHSESSATGTNYGMYSYLSLTGSYMKMYNNIISRTASTSTPLYYMYSQAMNTGDYNNYYAPAGNPLIQSAVLGTYSTLASWRTATGQDKNSLTYPVAYVSAATGNLTPDASNPNCWSMNGRGNHFATNTTDVTGAPRPTVPAAGVPDLGAYEFTPNAGVLPPNCTVSPTTPVAGGTQTYTFGEQTVATITWDAAATVPATAPTCQQYSGDKPVGFASFNNTSMYFHTDILTSSNALYTGKIYFMDPWIGTMANKSILHLAKKDGANPWVAYSFATTAANPVLNYLPTPATGLTTFGSYTGLDNLNDAGATDIVSPLGSFCAGTYNVSVRIKNLGSNNITGVKVDWTLDGLGQPQITYSPTISYNTGVAGSNEAIINLGPVTFGAAPRLIKVWTSLPNGVTDTYFLDDTLNVSMRAALSGVYTVGGTTPDFPTPTAAVTALNTVGICGNVTFNIRPGTYSLASGTALQINPVNGAGPAARVTFKSESDNAASVTITNNPVGTTDNGVFRLIGCKYINIKNLTLTGVNSSQWGAAITGSNTSYDTISGCVLNAAYIASYSEQNTINFYTPGTSSYVAILNNTINRAGYAAIQWYQTSTPYSPGVVIDGNTIQAGYMGLYTYGMDQPVINNNNIDFYPGGTGYPMYMYYMMGATVTNNKANGPNMGGSYYGMYMPYSDQSTTSTPAKRVTIANNILVTGKPGGNNYYALYWYGLGHADVYNNTILDKGDYSPTSYYTIYLYLSGYIGDSIYNNVFANITSPTGARPFELYAGSGASHYIDYNNYYTTASNFMYSYASSSNANFGAYRSSIASYGFDQNSISYDPGLDLTTGMPLTTNSNSWSLNGRGVQWANHNKDINGNPRPTTLAAGVPDIGAVEFEPTALPPAAVGTPAIPAPGVSQTFTFGYTPVAVIKWNTQLALTAPLTVRQYSGRIPPANFGAMTGGKQMYFYTDVVPSGTGTTYDFNVTQLGYYHTWLGTTNAAASVASEKLMKLAEKVPNYPWIAYNSANSLTTTPATPTLPIYGGYIYAPGLTSFGAFTGIDSGLVFSALIKVAGSTILCAGNSVILNADPTSGGSGTYTYQWTRNGTAIPGATSSTYAVTTGGDYAVTITGTGSQQSTSLAVTVTVVPPPMALITASGALTYCTGSALQLQASGGGTNYQWQLNGTDITGANTQNYNVTSAGTYTVKVSNIGCAATSTATIVNAGPINVNLGADIAACELKNQPYILDAGYPGAKYLWSTGDTTQTIAVNSGTGTYSVTVDAGPNCKGTDQIDVNLSPLPSVTGIGYQHVGNRYNFTASGAKNVSTYTWLFSDGTVGGGPSYSKEINGNLFVKLVISNSCGTDTINMVEWATNVNNVSNEGLDINVYPNPAKDKVNISIKGAFMKDVTVMNSIGEVVYRTEMGGQAQELDVNVSSFASGRYIIRANTTEGIISKPFNVQQR